MARLPGTQAVPRATGTIPPGMCTDSGSKAVLGVGSKAVLGVGLQPGKCGSAASVNTEYHCGSKADTEYHCGSKAVLGVGLQPGKCGSANPRLPETMARKPPQMPQISEGSHANLTILTGLGSRATRKIKKLQTLFELQLKKRS